MYDTDLFPFERSIKPGETFTSAKSGVAFFMEGRGIADPHWVMPSYTSQVLMKKGTSYQPPWFYNTWEPFFQNYDDTIVRESIPVASQMGLDVFTLDTGWSENYGQNEVDPKKFPEGFDGLRATLESKGMRLGLWEPLAVMGPHSTVVREHPEWIIRDLDGNQKTATFPGPNDRVMCLASPYRDWAARRINELIRRYNLRYVKIDLTTVFNAYGEAPGCYAQGHYHRNWAESLEGIYEGIEYVTRQIYLEHPDVLLDLTFELWGQKHIIDYGLLDAGDLDWLSNVDDTFANSAGARQARTLLYHRALAIPVETMLIGNLRATTPNLEEHFATVIGSAPLFLGDLRKLTPQQVNWLGEKIRWFKAFRRAVPIQEGFFPLGDWLQPNAVSWDGFARLSRRGEGVIVIFKNGTDLHEVKVQIPTYPPGQYKVRSVMTGDSLGTISGNQFQGGISAPLPAQYKVQILEIRK
jgi:alpha-galactosidase